MGTIQRAFVCRVVVFEAKAFRFRPKLFGEVHNVLVTLIIGTGDGNAEITSENRLQHELRARSPHRQMFARKLVPASASATPKCSAMVWPTSAKVARVPKSAPGDPAFRTHSSGTYSRE